MRFKLAFLVATVGVLGLAASALAQRSEQPGQPGGRGRGGPGGGPPMFGGGGGMGQSRMFLLSIPEIRKELELADEQVEAIQKVAEEIRAKYPFGGGRGGPPGGDRGRRGNNNDGAMQTAPAQWFFVAAQEPQNQPGQGRGRGGNFQISPEQRAEFEKQMQERSREERTKLAEILLPHQIKRLTEIFIQQAGVAALRDEEVAKELGISDAQKAKLEEVRQANQEAMAPQYREAFQLEDDARRAKFEELRKISDGKVLAVLTADQQKKFEAMKGKPFAMPEGAGRGRGGPGGPGRRPGSGGNNNN
jgi:Spy/CpxP family protein refolding chaperone